MHKKAFNVTKGGIFYLDKYKTVFDALDDNQLYYMIGRKVKNIMDVGIITGISKEFANQQKK